MQGVEVEHKYKRDIADINRHYLMLAREMIREDPDHAYAVMGLSAPIRKIIGGLSMDEIDSLSSEINILQFSLRINERHYSRLVTAIQADHDAEMTFPIGLVSAAQALSASSKNAE